jgi:hypothetical protein
VLQTLSFISSPLVPRRGDAPDVEHDELVLVSSPLFPRKLAKGYANPSAGVLDSVNGVHVRSLRQPVALLRDQQDEFVTFEFDHRGGEALVFPRKEMLAATEAILTDNGVRARGSPDMLQLWRPKGAK